MDDATMDVASGRKQVSTNKAPMPAGGYSQGMRAGGFLFLAGQGPFASDGTRAESIGDQVRQALANLDAVARAGGGSLQNAVRVGMYLSSLEHFGDMDAAYREVLPEPRPARTTIQSDLIGFDVEVDAVIWLGG